MQEKHFSQYQIKTIPVPNLIKVQTDSYNWFLKHGFKDLLDDFSPIEDYSGENLRLTFIDYRVEKLEHSEEECRERNLTYDAPIRLKIRLENINTKKVAEQEVYFGHLPLITNKGTFIINGIERIVVSQLLRSPGVYFNEEYKKGYRIFGAEIIPARGAWIEFETTEEGVIYVKIDRRRKITATAFLRALGLSSDNDIISRVGPSSIIQSTLDADSTKNTEQGLMEIYKYLRPGDLSTPENARQLLKNIFSFRKYDLEKVGRFKLNQRLGQKLPKINEIKKEDRLINLEDVILIIKEIIRLNQDKKAKPDDIDHLGNRRVRPVGMLIQEKLRVAFTRIERVVKDRMSTLDADTFTPGQLVNINIFDSSIQEFFSSSQLSQFMEQVNPLAELEHKRTLSSKGPGGLSHERAGFEVRDVHPSYYGRVCPIQTPEGQNVGLVVHLSLYAHLNEFGFIITPYFKVKNGVVTDEIEYLDAFQEQKYIIAHSDEPLENNKLVNKFVEARVGGDPGIVERDKVQFRDVSPQQCISVAASIIPFLEHDDANRSQMGSNMQRQAVPGIRMEAPLVATGVEKIVARDSGYNIEAIETGKVIEADAEHIIIKGTKSKDRYEHKLVNFFRSNQYSSISQKNKVKPGQIVKAGEIIATGSNVVDDYLALGNNLLVAFMCWEGYNYEDAIIISEDLVKRDVFSSVHVQDFTCEVRDTKLGPEITTNDIPNVSEIKLSNLDENGVIRVGSQVKEGSYLVGKISPKGEVELSGEERLLRAIFGEKASEIRDTSKVLSHGKKGKVVNIKTFSREKGDKLSPGVLRSIQVDITELRKISVGDKLAGRHGNKGVISKILPREDMPYLADGTPVDIILNPLGLPSRMNLGQILETHLGWAAKHLNYRAISPTFAGVEEKEILSELKKAGLSEDGRTTLYDGRTGEPFYNKITVGYVYMMKLNHLIEDKAHARSIGPYSLTTQQPLGGKAQFGGQRFGEMEVWALEAYGAAHILQEMLTIKSDDVRGRTETYESITKVEKIRKPNIPTSFYVLVNEIKGLGFNLQLVKNEDDKTIDNKQIRENVESKI
ncbi:MAG: DNA-directed RNA polymerase subunit beta [Patescibacteria group bacterium]|mgnify:CR=1 FL=1